MSDPEADKLRDKLAREAIRNVVHDATVLLVNHQFGEDPVDWDVGSGTLLEAASGRVAILTAWHTLEGRDHTLVHIEDKSPPDIDPVVIRLRGPSDTGLAILNDEVSARVRSRCIPDDCIGTGADCTTDRRVLLAGFPKQFHGNERVSPMARLEQFTCMLYWSTPKGIDNQPL